MKRKLLILTALLMLFGITAAAENVGDVIGEVYPTDIRTDICGYEIPAYNIGGETAVLVSTLSNYGFDVKFEDGIAYADYNGQKEKTPVPAPTKSNINVLYTDIKVKINGIEVPSFNIDGSMAIPIERTCETYLEANKDNEISDFSLNYIWCEPDKTLSLDISDDRVSYQDFMIDLIKAAHMDFNSNFYNHYVKTDDEENTNLAYLEKFSDIKNTKIEKYIDLLVKADLIDAYGYEDGSKLHPYRGVTRTDAAFLISRLLGCPYDYTEAFDYYISYSTYSSYDYLKPIFEEYKETMPDYVNYDIPAYDAYKIQEWSKPYFAHLLDINILAFDDNNYIKPNDFLTKDNENKLITLMLQYMEEGMTDKEIGFVLESIESGFKKDFNMVHTLTSPAQTVDGILYVPMYSIFNKTYREHFERSHYADALKPNASKESKLEVTAGDYYTCIFNNHYLFMGDWGVVYNVFPGINAYVAKIFRQSAAGLFMPKLIQLDYPVRKLYGEPMIPIYDYNTGSLIENLFGENFDTETNIYTFKYHTSYPVGS